MSQNVRHYCGLFAIANHPDAAQLAYLGCYAQQHRGQESAGICTSGGQRLERRVGMGLVTDAISPDDLKALANPMAVGHVRYSTTGSCNSANAQPLLAEAAMGQVAICHNGNLVNAAAIRAEYEDRGHIFSTTSDTEVILHMLADKSFGRQPDGLGSLLRQLCGSYCLLVLYPDRIEAVRDPSGNRPLCLGKQGNSWVVASETCALDIIDAEYVRDVEPGEIVTLGLDGSMSSRRFAGHDEQRSAQCIFEHVYFADPSSYVFGENVHTVRKAFGARLAREAPVDADLVIAIPNCARCAALGYHDESGIPIGRGFTTNHYVGRSFIQPTQLIRDLTVKLKLNPIRAVVEGKRLVVVEDSVVRGTTTRGKIQSLRDAGAKEIHLRVASPPIRHPCFYGIDFPNREELIANQRSVDEIRAYLGVDSLHFLSLAGMLASVAPPGDRFCNACFSGDYPIAIDANFHKHVFEKRQLRMFETAPTAAAPLTHEVVARASAGTTPLPMIDRGSLA
ncbi:MAG: amidophosphoribosyltransferase [Phycisphaerales bacterium]|nr:amidophosphoribosyltransferase [Phycisphaerales bacterium]